MPGTEKKSGEKIGNAKVSEEMSLDFLPASMARSYVGHERKAPRNLASKHPHLLKTLGDAWGKPTLFDEALGGLLISRRPNRKGFAPEVMEELFFMKSLHELAHPKEADTAWERVAQAFATPPEPITEESLGGGANEEEPEAGAGAEELLEEGAAPREERERESVRAEQAARESNAWGLIGAMKGIRALLMDRAEGRARRPARERLGQILARMGFCSREDALKARALQEGIALADLEELAPDFDALKLIPAETQKSLRALPLLEAKGWLAVAVDNPLEFDRKDYLEFVSQRRVELVWASAQAIAERLDRPFGREASLRSAEEFESQAARAAKPLEERRANERLASGVGESRDENDPTVVRLVEMFLEEGMRRKASDIHVEIAREESKSQIRFRVDGDLALYAKFDRVAHAAAISRLKIMAGLDISERRKPQDGKFKAKSRDGSVFEARLATVPMAEGWEGAVIRLLAAKEAIDLERLGLPSSVQGEFAGACESPHGIVLVCGPTGSGKTTTLHAALKRINKPESKIWTVEDPVEITQAGLCQTQVNAKAGYTFGAALRSLLRADPDVIMVGEIRDEETAQTALEAALTGHLVLSTLHTNSAAETASRLLDLGADPFALGDALRGILAQRLARRLCGCAKSRAPSQSELDAIAREALAALGEPSPSPSRREELLRGWAAQRPGAAPALREPVGCEKCRGSGHAGRVGVYELLKGSEEIAHLLREGASADRIRSRAILEGMVPLKAAALELALFGIISLREARAISI